MKVEFRNCKELEKAYEAAKWAAKLLLHPQPCPFISQWGSYDGDPDDIATRLIAREGFIQYVTMSGAGNYIFTPQSFSFEGAWRSLLDGCPIFHARPFAYLDSISLNSWDEPVEETIPSPYNFIGVELSIYVPIGVDGLCIYREKFYNPDVFLDDDCYDEYENDNDIDAEIKDIINKHHVWLDRYLRGLPTGELKPADLSQRNLRGIDLSYRNLSYANMSYADLRNAKLQRANLFNTDMEGSNLSGSNCQYVNFINAHLIRANFDNARVQGALFLEADLRGASFRETRAEWANFGGAKLDGANFEKAKIDEVAWPLHYVTDDNEGVKMDIRNISWFLSTIVNLKCDEPEFLKLKEIVKLFIREE